MKKKLIKSICLTAVILIFQFGGMAQCSLCSKTAQQMGEKPALGINNGILYLIFTPFALVGFIGYKWWKHNRDV